LNVHTAPATQCKCDPTHTISGDIMLVGSAAALERAQHGFTSPDIRMGNAQNGRQQLIAGTKSRVFLLWTVAHLTDTAFAGRGSIWPFVVRPGVIEATSPELCPCFFQVDLAPAILRFLPRDRTPPPLAVFVFHCPMLLIPSIPATYPSPTLGSPITEIP